MVTCILWADLMTSFSQLGLYLTDVLGNISFVKYQSWCMYLAKAIHILFCRLKIMLILYLSARSCNVVSVCKWHFSVCSKKTCLYAYISRYRIGPFEVESALIEHHAVAEAAVVSSPDPIRGEVS